METVAQAAGGKKKKGAPYIVPCSAGEGMSTQGLVDQVCGLYQMEDCSVWTMWVDEFLFR